jgi:hypothetical protein
MLALAGLTDDYVHDGRVLFEVINKAVLPTSVVANRGVLSELAQAYKEINAPLGKVGIKTLRGISTRALKGNNANYAALESEINNLKTERDNIAQQMIAILEGALFNGQPVDANAATQLINQANALLASIP